MENIKKYQYKNKISLWNKLLRLSWGLTYLTVYKLIPMNFFRIFILRLFGTKIGSHCKISASCRIWAPWNLTMGDYCCLAPQVNIYSVNKIILGSKVTISQESVICTASHDIETLQRELISQPIIISDHVWIAMQVFVSPGVSIGEKAIIAARSVITQDVEQHSVMAGNPAAHKKTRKIKSSRLEL